LPLNEFPYVTSNVANVDMYKAPPLIEAEFCENNDDAHETRELIAYKAPAD
jgi:hypothetical protein